MPKIQGGKVLTMISVIYRSIKVGFILVVLIAAFSLPHPVEAAEGDGYGRSVGAIVSWSGFVFISRDGVDEMIEVEDNESLYKGDVILTAKGSKAKILLNDDSILNISEKATFKIKDFVLKKKKSSRFARFKMITGSVRTIVGKYFGGKGSGFEIETETAVVGVKGTDFIVNIGGDTGRGDASEVFSLSGKVSTRAPSEAADKAIILRPGFKTKVLKGKRPTEPAKFNNERVRTLLSKTHIRAGISKEERDALVEVKRRVSAKQRKTIRNQVRKRLELLEGKESGGAQRERPKESRQRDNPNTPPDTSVATATSETPVAEASTNTKKKPRKVARRRGRVSAKNKSTSASARCSDCHQKVFRSIPSYTHQHPDTMSTCISCHLKDSSAESKYLAESSSTRSLMFLDTKRDMPYIVSATLANESGEEAESRSFEFTTSKLKDLVRDDGVAPVSSDPAVVAVKAGMFNSAVLEWKTDKPTLGYVEYGRSSKLGEKTKVASKQYSVDHSVSIDGLTVGKTYHFKAVSTDVFGNNGESVTVKFKVKKPFESPKAYKDGQAPKIKGFKVVKVGDRPALSWTTDVKTTAIIKLSEGISRAEIASDDPHYPGLKTNTASGHTSCKDCHKGRLHRTTAHSMGVVSYGGRTVKARELYYGDRGVLICSTCHNPHGGGFPHTLRKNQTDLCDTCHIRQ